MIEQGKQISDLIRKVNNLIRIGKVVSVDYTKAKAQVQIGTITTDYLPWLTPSTSAWIPLKNGEQVVVLSPNGDLRLGMILPALYQNAMPAPGTDENKIILNSDIDQTGDVNNNGNITSTGNVDASGNMTVSGNLKANGKITASGEITGNGKALSTHTHQFMYNGGEVPSSAVTQPPS